jgi:LysR family transcriptional regulator, hydrogen peroxide-inducible genes activator
MNVRDLAYIVAVERHGSITRAAEACGVSQPTLSTQVAKLERELGVALFERQGRGLRLTNAGRSVLDHARRALGAVDDLIAAAQDHLDPFAGTLRLGLIPTLAPYLLPHLLSGMRTSLPRLKPTIVEEQTALLLAQLRSGTIEAAAIATDPNDARLGTMPLFDEPLWVAMSARHPLASRAKIEPADIDPSTLLLLSEGHCLRDQAIALCADPAVGVQISGDFRAASLETIMHLVASDYGITFVPELYVKQSHAPSAEIALRQYASKGAFRRISLVYRNGTARRSALTEIAELTRDVWRRLSSTSKSKSARSSSPAAPLC